MDLSTLICFELYSLFSFVCFELDVYILSVSVVVYPSLPLSLCFSFLCLYTSVCLSVFSLCFSVSPWLCVSLCVSVLWVLGPGARTKGVFLGVGVGLGNAWAKCTYDFDNEKKASTVKVDVDDIVKKTAA